MMSAEPVYLALLSPSATVLAYYPHCLGVMPRRVPRFPVDAVRPGSASTIENRAPQHVGLFIDLF